MANRHPNSFRLSTRVSELYDFSLPFQQRRGPCLRRVRSRYSQLSPFTRPNSLTDRNRGFNYDENGQGSMDSTLDIENSQPSSSNSQDEDDNSVDNVSYMDSYSDSESDDSSSSMSLEPDEMYAAECDIKINVEDIGVDVETDKIDLTFNDVCNSNDTFDVSKSPADASDIQQVNVPRAYMRIDSIPSRQMTTQNKQLVNKLIKYARYNRLPVMEDLLCPDCKLVPKEPVTGLCGHTRCLKCIKICGNCPCGTPQPEKLHVNILVKNIIEKMIRHYTMFDAVLMKEPLIECSASQDNQVAIAAMTSCATYELANIEKEEPRYFTMTMEARFAMARRLVSFGYHIGAIPHLAHVAASQGSRSKQARLLLNECVTVLNEADQDRYNVRKLYRSVRNLSASNWLTKTEIECVVCVEFFKDPVTTYCGHTFCRNCLLRSINYSQQCPLCKRSLAELDVYEISETYFVTSMLFSIDSEKGPVSLEPDVVPIFMCVVALPSVPCPLLIIDARYWQCLRRLLGDDKREFGMVARHKDNAIPEYGTILEIRDCVLLRNGGVLLSTIGKWRFRITQTDFLHGCDVARVERLVDMIPQDPARILYLRTLADNVAAKANRWLSKMDSRINFEIESVYGVMPIMGCDETVWWESDDGPEWLWWLISILPLRSPIKILIFSAQCVIKRLTAVDVTLNTIDLLYKMKNPDDRKQRPTLMWKDPSKRRMRHMRRQF